MFNQGLSLDQAPPASLPFRFFLTAPLFGILLGLVFFFFPLDSIIDQYSPIAVASVHLYTLGILSMIIFGAMQQMMPVLAGAVIKKPMLFGSIVHASLTLGTLLFSASFLYANKIFLLAGSVLLAISFFLFFSTAIYLLFKVKFLTSTVSAMRLFSLCGIITALLGVYLSGTYITGEVSSSHFNFVNTHAAFGLFGFAVILVMGVAFQIIPMFYVALDFPKYIQNKIPIVVLILIIAIGLSLFFGIEIYILKLLLAFIFILFSAYGLNSLNNRRRPVFDVTLWFWKLSLIMFIVSMLSWLFVPLDNMFTLAVMFGFGFLYSLLQGMMYKIIPFLSWFHLSSSGYMVIPTMREMINEDLIKIQFFIFVSSLFFFILAGFLSNIFLYVGALLFIVANILLIINCSMAVHKYNKIAKTNPMDAFKNK